MSYTQRSQSSGPSAGGGLYPSIQTTTTKITSGAMGNVRGVAPGGATDGGGGGRLTGGYSYVSGTKSRAPQNIAAWNAPPSSNTDGLGLSKKDPKKKSSGAKNPAGFSSACFDAYKARKDPLHPPPSITGAEASRGVMSLIERGLLLPTSTSSNASASTSKLPPLTANDLLGGGLTSLSVPLHNPVSSFRRRDVAAASGGASNSTGFRGGISAAFNVKYDLALIEATIPVKALSDPTARPPPSRATLQAGIYQPKKPAITSKKSSSSQPAHPSRRPALEDDDDSENEKNNDSRVTAAAHQAPPREDTRTYTELLDLYSLHEFVIRKGSALRSTPEFASYMRSFEHQWGAISQLISLLEGIMQTFSVPLAYVDGKKLANLARVDLGSPSREELCSCVTNIAEIGHYLEVQSQAFRGVASGGSNKSIISSSATLTANSGHQAAATAIQSTYRMHRVKGYYQRLRVATWAVRVIQKQWACHRTHISTKKAISQLRDSMFLRWRETMEEFISAWPEITTKRRTIIHIPSLSTLARLTSSSSSSTSSGSGGGASSPLTTSNSSTAGTTATSTTHLSSLLPCLQAAQLPRLADLSDPNVDVILISPFKIDQEVLQHYTSSLMAARDLYNEEGGGAAVDVQNEENITSQSTNASGKLGQRGWTSPASRLVVLVPENARRLPPNLPLTSMVLLSTKMMRCLANLVRGKVAYIVPGEVGLDELQLASKLNIPLLGVEPGIATALATKGGQRSIFETADAATPVGAHNLRSVREAFLVIGRLIVEYRDISRWIFKIDSETGSRGHAVLDVQRLACYVNSSSSSSNINSNTTNNNTATTAAALQLTAEAVTRELAELAPKKIKIIHPEAYPDWISFMNMFDAVGGSVEAYPPGRVIASPTVNLFIDPHTGVPEVCSVVENVHSPSLTVLGHVYPPPCLLPTNRDDSSSSSSSSLPRVPYHVLRDAAIAIGASAYRRRVIGYCSVDFVVFLKPPTAAATTSTLLGEGGGGLGVSTSTSSPAPRLRIWAVDIDLRLTDGACMHKYVSLIAGCTSPSPDPTTGLSYYPNTTPSGGGGGTNTYNKKATTTGSTATLRYIYSGLLHHPYIGAVRHTAYFNKCRQRSSVAYSIQDRTGVIFHLVDSLLRGCIGMVGVGPTYSACIDSLADALQILQGDIPSHVDGASEGSNLANFTTALKILASAHNNRNRGTTTLSTK